jgi:uncharacterized spore protein YtfJ
MADETKPIEALQNLEKLFTSKTVVGDPIQIDGHTVVPLLAVGLGFGAGSGTGGDGKNNGTGGGYGGGGGVKPVALLISGKDGLRVERLVGATATTLEGIAGLIGKMRGASPGKQDNQA